MTIPVLPPSIILSADVRQAFRKSAIVDRSHLPAQPDHLENRENPEILESRLKVAFPKAKLQNNDPAFEAWIIQALMCLESPQRAAELPLDIQGTAFQRQVWAALQSIPPGSKRTYAQIANQIGKPKAVRAVAGACAANTIAVIVPCHRVVRSDGGLGGYRWGIERKQTLLEHEARQGE